MASIYTKTGDDGSTGLLFGGRAGKDDPLFEVVGDIDETVAMLGQARALDGGPDRDPDSPADLGEVILEVQRGLFVVGADLVAQPRARDRLVPDISEVTSEMVDRLERLIDDAVDRHPLRPVFVVPGASLLSATLDSARGIVRRAERHCIAAARSGHLVARPVHLYLNRVSDLLFVLARAAAGSEESPSHL